MTHILSASVKSSQNPNIRELKNLRNSVIVFCEDFCVILRLEDTRILAIQGFSKHELPKEKPFLLRKKRIKEDKDLWNRARRTRVSQIPRIRDSMLARVTKCACRNSLRIPRWSRATSAEYAMTRRSLIALIAI